MCARGKMAKDAGSSVCVDCEPGNFCDFGVSEASPCVAGKSSPQPDMPCALCPEGRSQNDIAQPSCKECEGGQVGRALCHAPRHHARLRRLRRRARRRNPSRHGRHAPRRCRAFCLQYCKEGAVTSVVCEAGSFSPSGDIACQKCEAGKMQPSGGKSQCLACAAGKYCNEGATAETTCPEGYFCPDPSRKTLCDTDGVFCPVERETEDAVKFFTCDRGFYCPDAVSQHPCVKSEFCDYGVTEPRLCQRGHRCPFPDQEELCPAFTYALCDGMLECLPCPPNSAPSYDRTTCICDAGYAPRTIRSVPSTLSPAFALCHHTHTHARAPLLSPALSHA